MKKIAEEIQRLERFVANGDAQKALRGYERLLARMPRDPVLRNRVNFLRDSLHRHAPKWQVSTYVISPQAVAEAHIMGERYSEALEILEWLLESNPEDTGLARRVAMVRGMRDGNEDFGIEPTASTHVMSPETLVEAHAAAGEIDAALRLLRNMIEHRKDNARLRERLAALEVAWGRPSGEIKLGAADTDPDPLPELDAVNEDAVAPEESAAEPAEPAPAAAADAQVASVDDFALEETAVDDSAAAPPRDDEVRTLPIQASVPRDQPLSDSVLASESPTDRRQREQISKPSSPASESDAVPPPLPKAPKVSHTAMTKEQAAASAPPPLKKPPPLPKQRAAVASGEPASAEPVEVKGSGAPPEASGPLAQSGPGMLEAMLADAQQTIKRDRLLKAEEPPPGGPSLAFKPEPEPETAGEPGTEPGKHSAKSPRKKIKPSGGKTKKPKRAGEVRVRRHVKKRRTKLGEGSGKDLQAGDPHLTEYGKLLGSSGAEQTDAALHEPFDIHEQLTKPDAKAPSSSQSDMPMASPEDFDELSTLAEARPLPRRPLELPTDGPPAQARPRGPDAAADLFDDDDEPTVADDEPPSGMEAARGGTRSSGARRTPGGPPAQKPTRPLRSRKKR